MWCRFASSDLYRSKEIQLAKSHSLMIFMRTRHLKTTTLQVLAHYKAVLSIVMIIRNDCVSPFCSTTKGSSPACESCAKDFKQYGKVGLFLFAHSFVVFVFLACFVFVIPSVLSCHLPIL